MLFFGGLNSFITFILPFFSAFGRQVCRHGADVRRAFHLVEGAGPDHPVQSRAQHLVDQAQQARGDQWTLARRDLLGPEMLDFMHVSISGFDWIRKYISEQARMCAMVFI